MSGVLLPVIGGTQETKSDAMASEDGRESSSSQFVRSVEAMENMDFPTVNAAHSVKARLSTIEEIVSTQGNHNSQCQSSFHRLHGSLNETDDNIKQLLLNMQNDFDQKILTLKKEYDHRFDLQSSENKRLQNHVASLKADTNQLKRKLQSTIEKLRKLQHEFGDPEEIEEESSIVSLGYRPSTTTF